MKYKKIWYPTSEDCDAFQHVNNVKYLSQLEKVAWEHSAELDIGLAEFEQENCALVVRRHEIDYLNAAHSGDELEIHTWLDKPESQWVFWRQYEIYKSEKLILKAKTQWVSVSLDSGRIKRMPELFIKQYWRNDELD